MPRAGAGPGPGKGPGTGKYKYPKKYLNSAKAVAIPTILCKIFGTGWVRPVKLDTVRRV